MLINAIQELKETVDRKQSQFNQLKKERSLLAMKVEKQ